MTPILHLPSGVTLTEVKRTQHRNRIEIYFIVDGRTLREGKNRLQLSLYYSKGGANYFTGTSEARGFYASVTPVTLDGHWISTSAFSGFKKLVKEAGRFSANILPTLEAQAFDFLKEVVQSRPEKYFEPENEAA